MINAICQEISYYFENEVILYQEEDEKYLEKIISSLKIYGRPTPLRINKERKEIQLAEAFVGIIRLPSKLVVIKPRFYVFDFDIILKMWLYTRYSMTEGMSLLPKFDVETSSSFAIDVCSIFVKEVQKLLHHGICGDYQANEELSEFVRGRINLAKSISSLPMNKIACSYEQFSTDTTLNEVILYCLYLVQPLLRDSDVHAGLSSALAAFKGVTLRKHISKVQLESIVLNRRSAYYQTVLDLCKIIVEHLSLVEVGSTVEFYSFLVDYNKLFEDFIRKILQERMGPIFSEWPQPKTYALFEDEYGKNKKTYLPDILYDYDSSSSSARIVLDVKNKMKYFSNLDIFQISFYSYMLKTRYGILVYPCSSRRQPKTISIKPYAEKSELHITALFFDLKKLISDFSSARDEFVNDVKNEIVKLFS